MVNKRCYGRRAIKREILAKIPCCKMVYKLTCWLTQTPAEAKELRLAIMGHLGVFYSRLNFLPVNFYVVFKLDHLHCCCPNAINLKNCQSDLTISMQGFWCAAYIAEFIEG